MTVSLRRWWKPGAAVLAVFLCLGTARAPAVGTDPAAAGIGIPVTPPAAGSTARRIVTGLVAGIERYLARDTGGTVSLTVGAPVHAVERGGEVTVLFPDARLELQDASALTLGDVSIMVSDAGDGAYDFATTLPRRMDLLDTGTGAALATLRVGENHLSGRWLARFEAAISGDFSLRDLRLVVPDGRTLLSVTEMAGSQDFSQGNRTVWKGPFDFTMSGVHLDVEQRTPGSSSIPTVVDLAGLRYEGSLDGIDVAAWHAITRELRALALGVPLSKSQAGRVTDRVTAIPWGRISITGGLSGLSVRERGKPTFAVDKAGTHIDLDDTRTPLTLGYGMEIEGLSMAATDVSPDLVPRRASLHVSVEGFPLRRAIALALPELLTMPPDAARAGTPVPIDREALTKLILEARPLIAIDEAAMLSDLLEITISGAMRVDPDAAQGGTGSWDGTVVGLDRAMRRLGGEMQTNPKAIELLPFLLMARGFGRIEPGKAGGEPVYHYHLEIGADGTITVNGTPLEAAPRPR